MAMTPFPWFAPARPLDGEVATTVAIEHVDPAERDVLYAVKRHALTAYDLAGDWRPAALFVARWLPEREVYIF